MRSNLKRPEINQNNVKIQYVISWMDHEQRFAISLMQKTDKPSTKIKIALCILVDKVKKMSKYISYKYKSKKRMSNGK